MSLRDGRESQAALRAMAHPVRLQIMSLLTGAPMTAAEVARELGLTHANASYHLRNLLGGGLIVQEGEERIRGGIAKRYRYVPDLDRGGPRTHGENQAFARGLANELIRRSGAADWTGPKAMADAELWLEPDDWQRLSRGVGELVKELHLRARPPRTPGAVRTSTTLAMFRLED